MRSLFSAFFAALLAGCPVAPAPAPDAGPTIETPPSGTLGFVELTLPGGPALAVLGDCDGDHALELLRRYGPLELYRLVGDAWTPVPLDTTGPVGSVTGAAFADLTLDGLTDLVVAHFEEGLWLHPGEGGCRFAPPRQLLAGPFGIVMQLLVQDVDRDGLDDLFLSSYNARTTPYHLLLARGDGGYEPVPVPATPWDRAPGQLDFQTFGAMFADLDGDGTLDLFALLDSLQSWFAWGVPGARPAFARDDGLSASLSAINAMSAAALDFDRDGRLEYFVSGNGLNNRLWTEGTRTPADRGPDAKLLTWDLLWSAYPFDADADGRTDLVVGATGDRPRLYWNGGDGTFVDLAETHVAGPPHSQNLSCGDLRGDGTIACHAYMTESTRPKEWLLANGLESRGNWLGLRLVGALSGGEATGARVTVEGDPPQTFAYGQASPTKTQHAAGLVIGLGAKEAATVRIAWPSGVESRHGPLAAGSHHVVREPAVFTLSRRVAPADGRTLLEASVSVPAGHSDVRLEMAGAGTLTLAGETPAGRSYRITAPVERGEARLTVVLDGAPLAVRPRLRFE